MKAQFAVHKEVSRSHRVIALSNFGPVSIFDHIGRLPAILRSIPMDWRDKAACLTADPELFFPVGNTGPAVDQIDKAKAVCGRCTVTEICLQYALETGQDSGVWGGLSEDERRALKRRAARARRAS
jgi:WhiB family redox-sensing transcriptional regulator